MSFPEWYQSVWGYTPFPWQSRFVDQWAEAIAVPTGAGKTFVIDAWLYRRLQGHQVPRRLWYVVDRRVLVDSAWRRAQQLVESTGADVRVMRLRGGTFDDVDMPRPDESAIICSTVDQFGSRLLMRGYGVGRSSLPLHAALAGSDALVVLDEAHISEPLMQTIQAARSHGADVRLLPMSATLADVDGALVLDGDDREDRVLSQRLSATKSVALKPGKAVAHAKQLRKDGVSTIAVWCNTVATAIETARDLRKHGQTILITGRDRQLDRDQLMTSWHDRLKSGANEFPSVYVVSTQCLEVGVDWDFAGMVTECASIDALKQRFGRLDRLGSLQETRAVIVKPRKKVPVYGTSAWTTWEWLNAIAKEDVVDFGLNNDALGAAPADAMMPSDRAPQLLPAHLDAWSMTSVRSAAIPEVTPWLHGFSHRDNDVRIAWRDNVTVDAVRAMPPTLPETASIPIGMLRDVAAPMLRWRGSDDCLLTTEIMPGDVVIVPSGTDGLSPSPSTDIAERASVFVGRPRVRCVGDQVIEWLDTLDDTELIERCGDLVDLSEITNPEITPYPGGLVVSQRTATSERAGRRVSLGDHSQRVASLAEQIARECGLSMDLVDAIRKAAIWHDVGKFDRRFQVWLGASDQPLAKSGHTRAQMRATWAASGYPRGQRHEITSAALAQMAGHSVLVQHLIAIHHGHCRPIVPAQPDVSPVEVSIEFDGCHVKAMSDAIPNDLENAFWELQQEHGYWGLALLSGILVAADHIVSASDDVVPESQEVLA